MEKKHISIKNLPEDDKPREKLIKYGATHLSQSELLAIVIGNGSKEQSAIELSQQLIKVMGKDLWALHNSSVEELCKIPELKGIGPAKACKIKAAIELGRRVQKGKGDLPEGSSPESVGKYLIHEIGYRNEEHFVVLLLNTKNKIYKMIEISKGLVNLSLAHPREVFTHAIRERATAIILGHNHPSGDLNPSTADLQVTTQIQKSGEIIGIPVLDHVIVGQDGFYSFMEHQLL